MGIKTPNEGGCWYCHTDDGPLLFSCEFDTYVHEQCLLAAVRAIPPGCDEAETRIMASELLTTEPSL